MVNFVNETVNDVVTDDTNWAPGTIPNAAKLKTNSWQPGMNFEKLRHSSLFVCLCKISCLISARVAIPLHSPDLVGLGFMLPPRQCFTERGTAGLNCIGLTWSEKLQIDYSTLTIICCHFLCFFSNHYDSLSSSYSFMVICCGPLQLLRLPPSPATSVLQSFKMVTTHDSHHNLQVRITAEQLLSLAQLIHLQSEWNRPLYESSKIHDI